MKISKLRNILKYLPDDYEIMLYDSTSIYSFKNDYMTVNFFKDSLKCTNDTSSYLNNRIDALLLNVYCPFNSYFENEIIVDNRCISSCIDIQQLTSMVTNNYLQMFNYWGYPKEYIDTTTYALISDDSTYFNDICGNLLTDDNISLDYTGTVRDVTYTNKTYDSTNYCWNFNRNVIRTVSGFVNYIDTTSLNILDTTSFDCTSFFNYTDLYYFDTTSYFFLINKIKNFIIQNDRKLLDDMVLRNMTYLFQDNNNSLIIRYGVGIMNPIFGLDAFIIILNDYNYYLLYKNFLGDIDYLIYYIYYIPQLNNDILTFCYENSRVINIDNGIICTDFNDLFRNSLSNFNIDINS